MKYISIVLSLMLFFNLSSLCFASSDTFDGLDISSYQGDIDFTEVYSAGYEYVYIRAGEGDSTVDSRFSDNYTSAESAGIKYGFYYYVTATSTSQAETQATQFASLIEGTDYTLRPAMDYESFGDTSTELSNQIALAFLTKLEELTGVTPAVYSNAYTVETRWDSSLSSYPLWVAAYKNLSDPSSYTLPENTVWTSWSGYQYSDTSTVSGIDGYVDSDLFTSDLVITTEPAPDPEPEPSQGCTVSYTVKANDTLWKVGNLYNVTVDSLVEKNSISNRDLIYVGDVITIPLK